MKLQKTMISIICCLSIIIAPMAVHAEETTVFNPSPGLITKLQKNQKAPFEGILFSNDAAAKLYASLSFTEEECKLRISKGLEFSTLKYTTQIELLNLRLQVNEERYSKLLGVKDQRIGFLEKNLRPTPWYESGEFWFAMGVVGGILITVASGYAINQASK